MLVTLNDVLEDAQKNHYAVGLFNTLNMEMARGVIQAAEELRSPVIIGTAEVLLKFTPLEELSYFLLPLARNATVPVVLHFDHGLTEAAIIQALKCGFTSVMYDCSTESYGDNVRKVSNLARIAHMFGATIEGELGHVGKGSDGSGDLYTLPEEAKSYVQDTGVDALAVAIGTAHGIYQTKPNLDITRLRLIHDAVKIPLVLHGGSGLSDEDFAECIQNGISKINIFTDINCVAAASAASHYSNQKGMSLIINDIVADVKKAAQNKILLFGSQNRA